MEDFVLLKDIKYGEELICDWPFVGSDVSSLIRVYYRLESAGNGFYFYSMKCTGGKMIAGWDPDSTLVECLYSGQAYFDGVRHLYMGDEFTDNYGYDHCPSLKGHIEILTIVSQLVEKYCKEG